MAAPTTTGVTARLDDCHGSERISEIEDHNLCGRSFADGQERLKGDEQRCASRNTGQALGELYE